MAKKQDELYFNNFIECAQYASKAAALLSSIMSNFDKSKLQQYADEMHNIEHSADIKKHELTEALVKAFITPIDREDIAEVSQNLDELTDKIEDVLIRIYCNHVTEIRPDAIELVNIVVRCCDEVLALMGEFANYKRSKKLKEHLININSLEEEADRLYISCMYNLHGECDNPITVIAWRDIYTYLEKCSDTAEHVAYVVESVIMKNS